MNEAVCLFNCTVTADSIQRLQAFITNSISNGAEKIVVLFDSRGGQYPYALEFYDFMNHDIDQDKIDIAAVNVKQVRSSATTMFLAFNNRSYVKGAVFHFHAVVNDGYDPSNPLHVEQYIGLNDAQADIIDNHTLLPKNEVVRIVAKYPDYDIPDSDVVPLRFADELPSLPAYSTVISIC